MSTKGLKHIFAGAALLAAAGFAAPALADPFWVSNVTVPSGVYSVSTSLGSVYYAGQINFTMNPGTSYDPNTTFTTAVWCDDFYNPVYIGSQNQYYSASANTYLAPLTSSQIHNIAGLAFYGDQNLGNATVDAEVQLAIWEIEYGMTVTDGRTPQSQIQTLLNHAHAEYIDMLLAGDTYIQLESPGCGQTPGSLTYTSSCQTQGQIAIVPGGDGCCSVPVPEPGPLGLLGSGLVAFGAWRRRSSSKRSRTTIA